MATQTRTRTVTVCDLCHGEGRVFTKCIRCGKDYCYCCETILPGCIVGPDLCKHCGNDESVRAIVSRYAAKLAPIIKKRDAALAQSVAVAKVTRPTTP